MSRFPFLKYFMEGSLWTSEFGPRNQVPFATFNHHLGSNVLLTNAYWTPRTTLLMLRRTTPEIAAGQLFSSPEEDYAYLTCNKNSVHAAGCQWGSGSVIKASCRISENSQSLTVSTLFPDNLESWCQLLGDAAFGIRKTYKLRDFIHVTGGVQTSRLHSSCMGAVLCQPNDSYATYAMVVGNMRSLYPVVVNRINVWNIQARFIIDGWETAKARLDWRATKNITLVMRVKVKDCEQGGVRYRGGISVVWEGTDE